jgi:N-acetylglucosamine malate deacetylase 1
MKLDILVLAVHPDDAELGCGGTILKHIAQGAKVGMLDFTVGELGTRGSGPLRLKEAEEASKILGFSVRENLGFRDGFFKNDEAHQLALIQKIRKYRPNIILSNALEDRHPDHGRANLLATEACFYSGLKKVITLDENNQEQEAWRPPHVYSYIQDRYIDPDFVVDITPFWEQKKAAILAFKSQFYDPNSSEPESYISSAVFFEFLEARAREMGHKIGVKYGEAFTAAQKLSIKDLRDLSN